MSSKSIFFPRFSILDDQEKCDFIENDDPDQEFILPNQSTANGFQIILPKTADTIKNYYKGWWIKTLNGEIRKVKEYTGGNRICILEKELTTGKSKDDTIFMFKKSNSIIHFDEKNKKFIMGYSPNEDNTENIDLSDLQVHSLDVNKNLNVNGSISILNENQSFYTKGDTKIEKNLFVNQSIFLCDNQVKKTNVDLQIQKEKDILILLESGIKNQNTIQFSNTESVFELKYYNNSFYMQRNQRPILTAFENGNISIGSTLTLSQDSTITTENNHGFLKLMGGNDNNKSNDNSCITIHGRNSNVGNKIELNAADHIQIVTNKFDINNVMSIKNSHIDINSIVNINSSAQISKNLTVHENIYVNGQIFSENTRDLGTVNILSNINCNISSIDNINTIQFNDQILLTFVISVLPTNEMEYCIVEFELPQKEQSFKTKKDIIFHFSGYSDDEEMNNIYNMIGTSKIDTKNGIIRFQPNSMEIHNISVWCRYST